jgi:KipI family sensor histidine kinase inhibitor
MTPEIKSYGDHAVLVQWATEGFSQPVNDAVHDLCAALRATGYFREVVPGYDSVVAVFDLGQMLFQEAEAYVEAALAARTKASKKTGQLIEIPVHYGGQDGPDMDTICAAAKLSADAVIALHSQSEYRVCMMGFIPGFTFLSPAPEKLHHPRLATPRAKVPAGSIGIANWQTGIYGLESPGGWQIIGRTPLAIFDAMRDTPFALNAGDRVRFVPL